MNPLPSVAELRALCQKTAPNPERESVVGRFSRIFSIYVTRILIRTPLTPNQITVLSTIVFFVGLSMFSLGSMLWNIVGSAVIFFSIILDGCDGEVARYKKNGSIAGTLYVEPVSHDVQYGLAFPLLGAFVFLQTGQPVYLVLGFVASVAKLLYRHLETRFWTLQHQNISDPGIERLKQEYRAKPVYVRLVYWVNKNIFSSTGVFLMIFAASLAGRIDMYLWLYGLGYAALWLVLFLKQVRLIAQTRS